MLELSVSNQFYSKALNSIKETAGTQILSDKVSDFLVDGRNPVFPGLKIGFE